MHTKSARRHKHILARWQVTPVKLVWENSSLNRGATGCNVPDSCCHLEAATCRLHITVCVQSKQTTYIVLNDIQARSFPLLSFLKLLPFTPFNWILTVSLSLSLWTSGGMPLKIMSLPSPPCALQPVNRFFHSGTEGSLYPGRALTVFFPP